MKLTGTLAIVAMLTMTGSALAQSDGWTTLFDGKTLEGWRAYKSEQPPAGWTVKDGVLARTGAGGDLMTVKQYGDFELELEWRVAPGGNSGVFYRATETGAEIWETFWQDLRYATRDLDHLE